GSRYWKEKQRRRLRDSRVPAQRLYGAHVVGGPGDLRELQGGGQLSHLLRGLQGQTARWRDRALHRHVRAGSAAAGERLLVADNVRVAGEPADGESDRPLPD